MKRSASRLIITAGGVERLPLAPLYCRPDSGTGPLAVGHSRAIRPAPLTRVPRQPAGPVSGIPTSIASESKLVWMISS